MKARPKSLKRRLLLLPLLVQFITLLGLSLAAVSVALRIDSGGPYSDEQITGTIASAISLHKNGMLELQQTDAFRSLRARNRDLWFVVQDDFGRTLVFGNVPPQYSSLARDLRHLSFGQIRGRASPYALSVVMRREAGPSGSLTVLAHGDLTELSWTLILASNVIAVPVWVALAIVSLVLIPWIVSRSLAGIRTIAREAEDIDAFQPGRRLSEEQVPIEVAPLIRAVNGALSRIDEGQAQQQRFFASAAHELRTPIAILRLKVESSPDRETRKLLPDVERLGSLAEQLLDLQRLSVEPSFQRVELSTLAKRVAGDLAPLLLSQGRTIEVVLAKPATIEGDESSLTRVLINLLQNGAEHGADHLTLRVDGHTIEVQDDGPGIPESLRDQVFEPFVRLRPRGSGSGLGLTLVRQIVHLHGGRISLHDAPSGGTLVRISFG